MLGAVIAFLGLRRTIEYGAALLILLSLIGYGLYERHQLIQEGEADALQKVEAANAAAEAKAKKGQDDVADCYDGGGAWDRSIGVCNGPAAGK